MLSMEKTVLTLALTIVVVSWQIVEVTDGQSFFAAIFERLFES